MTQIYNVWKYVNGTETVLFTGTMPECLAFVSRETRDNPTFENIMSYHFQVESWI